MQAVTGKVKWLLRLEGVAIFAVSLLAYSRLDTNWITFITFFLTPDIALIGYLFNNKIGAVFYNFTHSLIGPALLICLAIVSGYPLCMALSSIWVAHVGFDRALGYGLKYSSGFRHTHLGSIGQKKA